MPKTYHMIDYIHDDAVALQHTLEENEATIERISDRVDETRVRRMIICGTGSSYSAAVMSTPIFRYHCRIPVHVLSASDLMYYFPRLVDQHTLVVGVSRSGERGQVVNALHDSFAQGALCVGMTGVSDSLLAQSGQITLLTREGPEVTFPKTKSVTACTGLLMRLALALAEPGDEEVSARLQALRTIPGILERTTEAVEEKVRALIPEIRSQNTVLVAGTGSNYGVSLEAAMKIGETAYIPTHYDDTGNLLHSPMGVTGKEWLSILLVTHLDLELSKRALKLIGEFGSQRLSIVEPGLDLEGLSEHSLRLPERVDPFLEALVYLLPIQLITYYWAVARGLNPDAPASMHATLAAVLAPGRKEPELR